MGKRLLLLAPAVLLAAFFTNRPATGQTGEKMGNLRDPSASVPPRRRASRPCRAGPCRTGARPRLRRPTPIRSPPRPGLGSSAPPTTPGRTASSLPARWPACLRDKHRMPAFIYNRAEEERAKQRAEWMKLKQRYPGAVLRLRTVRIEDQYAVLVGGYRDLAAATAALPAFRKLPLPELKLQSGRNPYAVAFKAKPTAEKQKYAVETYKLSPFAQAMAVRNPRAAGEARTPPDPALKELNQGQPYDLLKNPKPYTLVVKFYGGAQCIQSGQEREKDKGGTGFLAMLGMGGSKPGAALAAGAAQAQELARLLRHPRFGFDSYVMHTRTGSVVAVGGFLSAKDPAVAGMLRRLDSLRFNAAGGADPIGLMPTPMMIEVPRF